MNQTKRPKPFASLGARVGTTLATTLGLCTLGVALFCFAPRAAHAEEGMWLLSDLPRERLQKNYSFDPSEEWLLHVQRSAVRLGNGCSGSFVSPQGLVMTNHHCAVSCIGEHSNAGQDLLKNGFYATQRENEKK